MLLGPIFSLELVTGARRARYFWLRVLYALTLLFALWVTYESAMLRRNVLGIQGIANVARDFFFSFALIQLAAVLALTPAMVSGTIAQERERRTLEYLLTSQLSSGDIILGKLAARLLHVVFVLLAGIPVLAAAMLLGGIPPLALLVTSVATLLTLLAVGSLSIMVSVWRKRTRDAIVVGYVLLLGLLVIPPLGANLQNTVTQSPLQMIVDGLADVLRAVSYTNPFLIIVASASSEFQRMIGGGLRELSLIFASYLAFSAVCLSIAALSLRRSASNDAVRSSKRRRWRVWRPPVGRHPMLWKELFAESSAARLGWIGRAVIGLMVLMLVGPTLVHYLELRFGRGQASMSTAQIADFVNMANVLSVFIACFGLMILTARAATLVTSEKERECWVNLLSTPLSAAEIVSAKLLGNLYAARWYGLLLGFNLLLAALADPRFLGFNLLLFLTWALLACYAGCLGLTFSMLLRNSTRAMSAALAAGVFFGGVYLMFTFPMMAVLQIAGQEPWAVMVICIPYLLSYPIVAGETHAVSPAAIPMLVTYLVGMGIYVVVSASLWSWCIAAFDQRSGRMREK